MTITETPAEIIHYGWEVYRRSQQIPWPTTGARDLLIAQSRLWHCAEPYASGRVDSTQANLAWIQKATADLIGVLRRHCGVAQAAFASGQDRSVAA